VNIVNFIVTSYVPPGRTKGSSSIRVFSTYGIHHTSSKSALMVYLGDVYWRKKALRSLNDVTHHHMEDIMGHSALMQRFVKVDSFIQPYMKTQRILSGDVECVRGMGISIQEISCHSPTTFRLSPSMSRELTIWDHSQSQKTMSTSRW
jgi:hypothetical protein